MVPELDGCKPHSNFDLLLDQVKLGQDAIGKKKAVPLIVGPVTLVERSSKTENHDDLVKKIVPLYKELLQSMKGLDVTEVCIHEPSVVLSNSNYLQSSFEAA